MKWRMWGAFWVSIGMALLHLANIICLVTEDPLRPLWFAGVLLSVLGATIAGWGFYSSVNALHRMKSRRIP
jgi:hypothetical protein